MLSRSQKPLLIVISGPSGVGKDSVINRMKERGLPFRFVITANTRPQRPDEIDGVDYFFVTHEEFEQMIEDGELFEYAVVYEDLKGVPKNQIEDALASGEDVIMRLDVQGAETIRAKCPEALMVFLSTRNEDELIARLKTRRTESEESLTLRIKTAREEFERVDSFDYYVVNEEDKLDETVDTILSIIQAEHARTTPREVSL
ncbi:MAG: guanylate kinase [Anaerolineales bacterium]